MTDIHVKENCVRINLQRGDVILARSLLKKAGVFSPPSFPSSFYVALQRPSQFRFWLDKDSVTFLTAIAFSFCWAFFFSASAA